MEQLTPELFLVAGNAPDSFVVDDLLDFSNDKGLPDDGFDTLPDSSSVSVDNPVDSSNSSSLYADGTGFSDDLCVPVISLQIFSNSRPKKPRLYHVDLLIMERKKKSLICKMGHSNSLCFTIF